MKELTGVMNLMYNVNMENEDNIIMKKWFPAEPLIKGFLKGDSSEARTNFCNRLGIDHSRLMALQKPGQMISSNFADKYAIRLRIPSLHDMG